jgi:hypothetical protein
MSPHGDDHENREARQHRAGYSSKHHRQAGSYPGCEPAREVVDRDRRSSEQARVNGEEISSHSRRDRKPHDEVEARQLTDRDHKDQVGHEPGFQNGLKSTMRSQYDLNQVLARIQDLQKENDDLNHKVQAGSREKDRLRAHLDKLQRERLAVVDRFQPEFDEQIELKFRKVRQPVSKLSRFVASNLISELASEDLTAKLVDNSSAKPVDGKPAFIDLNDKDDRRRIWTSIIWKFLDDQIFHRPFLCFGGKWAETLDGLYPRLFPMPSKQRVRSQSRYILTSNRED